MPLPIVELLIAAAGMILFGTLFSALPIIGSAGALVAAFGVIIIVLIALRIMS